MIKPTKDWLLKNIILSIMLMCNSPAYSGIVSTTLKTAFNKGIFILPESQELQLVHRAFQLELQQQSAIDIWQQLAIQRQPLANYLLIKEQKNQQTGRGIYAINNEDKVKPWLIQAPHAKSDLLTGKIADLLFSENKIKAAMWNSVPRKTLIENSVNNKKADMAHLANTYWQIVTEVFATQFNHGKIIQLHGFAQSKRTSEAGKQSDIIISSGHKAPSLWVTMFAQCLKQKMPGVVKLYPDDVKELGGTTNSQVNLLKNLDFEGFVHIEMSKQMRQNLLRSKKHRDLLLSCIQ